MLLLYYILLLCIKIITFVLIHYDDLSIIPSFVSLIFPGNLDPRSMDCRLSDDDDSGGDDDAYDAATGDDDDAEDADGDVWII